MSESNKANEISISKFQELTLDLQGQYKVSAQLCRISGNRWAYVAGEIKHEVRVSRKVKVNPEWGIILYGDCPLKDEEILNLLAKEK